MTPQARPTSAAATMPIRAAPRGRRRAVSTAITANVPMASRTGGDFSAPNVTSVPGAATMRPAHSRPINGDQQADADADGVLEASRESP